MSITAFVVTESDEILSFSEAGGFVCNHSPKKKSILDVSESIEDIVDSIQTAMTLGICH